LSELRQNLYHVTLATAQFRLFRQERKLRNREVAERHLELAAMFGHETARILLARRKKKQACRGHEIII
jgi:hypothetical protein